MLLRGNVHLFGRRGKKDGWENSQLKYQYEICLGGSKIPCVVSSRRDQVSCKSTASKEQYLHNLCRKMKTSKLVKLASNVQDIQCVTCVTERMLSRVKWDSHSCSTTYHALIKRENSRVWMGRHSQPLTISLTTPHQHKYDWVHSRGNSHRNVGLIEGPDRHLVWTLRSLLQTDIRFVKDESLGAQRGCPKSAVQHQPSRKPNGGKRT